MAGRRVICAQLRAICCACLQTILMVEHVPVVVSCSLFLLGCAARTFLDALFEILEVSGLGPALTLAVLASLIV